MKKKVLVLCIFVFIFITGCGNYKEIKHVGDELIYNCSKEELEILQNGAKVTVDQNQGFILISESNDTKEYPTGQYDVSKNYGKITKNCVFINYNEVKDNKFGTIYPIAFKDPEYGVLKFTAMGTYSYKIVDSKKFINNYSGANFEDDLFNSVLLGFNNMIQKKSSNLKYNELISKTSFSSDELREISEYNYLLINKGIQITELKLQSITLTDESQKIINSNSL